jgi:SAM-dependent methyltransferase
MLNILRKIYSVYRTQGLRYLYLLIKMRMINKPTNSFLLIKSSIIQGEGLEIGGPSSIFNDSCILPIYEYIDFLDNCNYSTDTIWFQQQSMGKNYNYHPSKEMGHQFIEDSVNLSSIKSESYDFLLSSHVLEHIANPIKALHEWKRVIKVSGHLIIVVPHKDATFDHQRPITTLQHLIQDFENNIEEDDLTHMEEILNFHDFSKDAGSGSFEIFKNRSIQNIHYRALHHHVFTTLLLAELMDYMHMQIKSIEAIWPMHILVIAEKVPTNITPKNDNFLSLIRSSNFKSPFQSDKR